MLTSYLSKLPVSSTMGILIASCSALYLCNRWLLSKHSIPGPPRLPIVGSLPFMVGDIREVLAKMKKKYGDIFVLYVGSERIVVLNGYETIKEALLQNEGMFDGRSQKQFSELTKNLGVASSQGDIWQEQRRFVLKTLRNFGFGRRGMEHYISEEAIHLKKILASVEPKTPCDIYHFITMATCNVICSVVNGRRCDYSDPEFTEYVDLSKEFLSYIGVNNPVFVFHMLKYIPGDLFGYKKALSISDRLHNLYKEWITKHRYQLNSGEETADLIGVYLREMDKCKVENEYFFDDQLAQVIMDLFLAGTDTTANTLAFAILYLIINFDIQLKVQEEIDRVIGSHRNPTYADRFQMPYTQAVLSEVQRITDVAPLAIPHATMADTSLRGYTIAKGTTVIINLHSVLWDEQNFPDPECFKPERFLDDKGSFVSSEACIPFSLGKRSCLAESMAKAELFLLFTHLLQNFTFRLPPNQPIPDTYGVVGITVQPKPFCVLVENRLV